MLKQFIPKEELSSLNWEKSLPGLILKFLECLKKQTKSNHTVSAYKNDLKFFLEFIIESKARIEDFSFPIQEYFSKFLKDKGRQSQASQRRAQMSVRTFLHFLIKEKMIESSPFLETKSPRQPAHSLLLLKDKEYKKLLTVLKRDALLQDPKSVRDWCLFLLLGELALKASEAANLSFGQILEFSDLNSNRQEDFGYIKVPGEKTRHLPLSKEIRQAFHLLEKARQALGLSTGKDAKLFFALSDIRKTVHSDCLHRHGIKFIIYGISEKVLGVPYNAESLRNRAIKSWLESGLEKEKVAELAGYSSLNSLERFYVKTTSDFRLPRRQLSKIGKDAS